LKLGEIELTTATFFKKTELKTRQNKKTLPQ